MNITSDPNLWVISALLFLLGLLIGVFLTAGGRRKWKARYRDEVDRREALQRDHDQRVREMDAREKEWNERETKRAAAIKSSGDDRDVPAA